MEKKIGSSFPSSILQVSVLDSLNVETPIPDPNKIFVILIGRRATVSECLIANSSAAVTINTIFGRLVQNPTFSAEDSKVSVYYTNESPKMASFNRTFGTAERKAFLSALFEDSVSGVKRSWNTEYAPYTARTEDMPRKPLDAVVRG